MTQPPEQHRPIGCQRQEQERGQPPALHPPLQGADQARRVEAAGTAARSPTWSAARRSIPAATSPSRCSSTARRQARASSAPATRSSSGRPHQLARPAAGRRRRGAGGRLQPGRGRGRVRLQLTREEFLDFFEDLELPNLVAPSWCSHSTRCKIGARRGSPADGMPANINIVRSLRGPWRRRIAMRAPYPRACARPEASRRGAQGPGDEQSARIASCERRSSAWSRSIDAVPFIDTFDLRYNNRINQPQPTSRR
jgi:uncharacterized sporulation protein YeaH/YhbH (DUF444 family)